MEGGTWITVGGMPLPIGFGTLDHGLELGLAGARPCSRRPLGTGLSGCGYERIDTATRRVQRMRWSRMSG